MQLGKYTVLIEPRWGWVIVWALLGMILFTIFMGGLIFYEWRQFEPHKKPNVSPAGVAHRVFETPSVWNLPQTLFIL